MNAWPAPNQGFNTDRAQLQQLGATGAEVLHNGVHCAGCGAQHVYGIRYKCAVCPAFDLCERCEAHADRRVSRGHPAEHPFLKIRVPLGAMQQQAQPNAGAGPMNIGGQGPIGNAFWGK